MTDISASDILNISANDISRGDRMEKHIVLTESMYYILLSVLNPNHGYGIIQKTLEMTEERVEIGAGTLYGAINTLLDKGWIELYSEDKASRKKKQYVITAEGRIILEREISRLEELLRNGKREMQQQEGESHEED